MASKIVTQGARQVKPILSLDLAEAQRRVRNLYKAWYRQIPFIVLHYDIPVSEDQGKQKLREMFEKHKHMKDIRAIDMLVVKGQMELVETVNIWKQKNHVMAYFKDTVNPRPEDFMSKFLEGQVWNKL